VEHTDGKEYETYTHHDAVAIALLVLVPGTARSWPIMTSIGVWQVRTKSRVTL
jgi:hypothetical protein